MSARTALAAVFLGLALVTSPRAASASPSFPDAMAADLGLPFSPVCTVCHTTPAGGRGTATTAFGSYLRSRGLVAGDLESLKTALAAAAAERHDSNGNGVPDIDELRANQDPNAVVAGSRPPPEYGCGRIAPPSSGDRGGALVASLFFVVVLACRLRRGSAGRALLLPPAAATRSRPSRAPRGRRRPGSRAARARPA